MDRDERTGTGTGPDRGFLARRVRRRVWCGSDLVVFVSSVGALFFLFVCWWVLHLFACQVDNDIINCSSGYMVICGSCNVDIACCDLQRRDRSSFVLLI